MSELKYAVLRANDYITFKEIKEDSYTVLKREIKSSIGVVCVGELDIWYDDEFLLKDELPDVTLIIKNVDTPFVTHYDTVLRGPVVFASSDYNGDTISLTGPALEVILELIPIEVNGKMAYMLPCYE